jgi:hypothetical protein
LPFGNTAIEITLVNIGLSSHYIGHLHIKMPNIKGYHGLTPLKLETFIYFEAGGHSRGVDVSAGLGGSPHFVDNSWYIHSIHGIWLITYTPYVMYITYKYTCDIYIYN